MGRGRLGGEEGGLAQMQLIAAGGFCAATALDGLQCSTVLVMQ